jgi:hypothetical protein
MATTNTKFNLQIEGLNVVSSISKILKFDVVTKSESLYQLASTDGWKEICYDEVPNASIKMMNFITQQSGEDFKVRRTFYVDVTDESLYTGATGTTIFTGQSADNTPIKTGSVVISYTVGAVNYTATDDGEGALTGTELTSGTVDYTTGAIALTFNTEPDDGSAINVSYTYTDANNSVIEKCKDFFMFGPDTGVMDTIQKIEVATDNTTESVELFVQILGV